MTRSIVSARCIGASRDPPLPRWLPWTSTDVLVTNRLHEIAAQITSTEEGPPLPSPPLGGQELGRLATGRGHYHACGCDAAPVNKCGILRMLR